MTVTCLPEKTRVAAFDVDAQQTFTPLCPKELPVPGGDEIVPELNAQTMLAGLRVGSKDAHPANAVWVTDKAEEIATAAVEGRNVDVKWPVHAVPGTAGFELIPGLPAPADYDYFVWKGVEPDMHPYGACYHDLADRMSTGVIEFLRARGIDTVLVGGLATDYCLKTTALQLRKAGFRVIVNLAACRAITPEGEAAAIDEMHATGIETVAHLGELEAAA